METKNAIIESTTLGYGDHGAMSFWLTLDYGGTAQGFGGYALDGPGKNGHRVGSAFGLEAIMGVLTTLGVERWEKLPGTPLRVRGGWDKIEAIGHHLKDQWLDLAELARRHSEPVVAARSEGEAP